jgi:hypothetical protein
MAWLKFLFMPPINYNSGLREVPVIYPKWRVNGKQVKYLCCPRNGKQVWVRHLATGETWEGGASSLVSPETGLTIQRKCRGVAAWA